MHTLQRATEPLKTRRPGHRKALVQFRRVQAAIEHDDRELAAHLVARAVVSCEGMAVAR